MRVIEPRRKEVKMGQAGGKRLGILLLSVLLAVAVVWLYEQKTSETDNKNKPIIEQPIINTTGTLRTFKGQEFVDFYYTLAFPNTQKISEDAPITGDGQADEYLRHLAKERGYRPQNAPVADVLIDVGNGVRLQPKAAVGWRILKNSATKEGLELNLTAGFRSAEDQTRLFLERLSAAGVNISQIPSGAYDAQIEQVLKSTALPGYSKHHSGYTVDIGCPSDPGVIFEKSICFAWLNRDNYKNAKNSGWIPSYPEGANQQGPDPETWEYVWVGRQNLVQ